MPETVQAANTVEFSGDRQKVPPHSLQAEQSLLGGLLLTVIFIAFAQLLLPSTISTTNDIWYEQVRGKVMSLPCPNGWNPRASSTTLAGWPISARWPRTRPVQRIFVLTPKSCAKTRCCAS